MFFRCLKKLFQEERSNKKEGNSRVVTVQRDQDDGTLGFDLGFVSYNNTDFDFIFAITGCFQKVNFHGFNLVILNFELPSAFLCALYKLFKK